jgi:transposase
VVAPSLIPKGSGDRVKTDKRDSRRLARLHRAGELTPVRVPSRDEEAVRDLARARTALLEDRKTAQKRLTAILMRHGRTWRGPTYWTRAHRDWIAAQKFAEPALATAVGYYRAALATREAEMAAIEAELLPWVSREPLVGPAARLMCYRGIAELTALTLAAEVVDWRRFPAARAFMGFTGLCPAEASSGDTARRGHITKAGPQPVRTALVESALAYRHPAAIGACCAGGSATRPRTPWPAPGRPSGGCTPGTFTWSATARPRRRPSPRPPASSPGSPGPR